MGIMQPTLEQMRTVRKRIDNRDFVVAYMTCNSIDDVAKTMGMPIASVNSKTTYLRKMGVKLPRRFKRGSKFARDLEIAQLNSLINKCMKRS